MNQSSGPRGSRRAKFSARHVVGLFVFYAILAFCILTFTFFYVFNVGELRLVTVLTLGFAVVATAVHVRSGRRDRIDTLIERGP
jgi:hypothetical protein